MKNRLVLFIGFTLFSVTVSSQKISNGNFNQISKKQYDSCSKPGTFILHRKIKKQGSNLVLILKDNKRKIFTGESSDTNFKEYQYIGDIKSTVFSLVKMEEYNREEFYLINQQTGKLETLIGNPVFNINSSRFACINNPGTDEKQFIHVYQIKEGKIVLKACLQGKPEVFFESVSCVNLTSVLLKDNNGNYWKLDF